MRFKKYNIDFELDDVRTTEVHGRILKENLFLKKIYFRWYSSYEKYVLPYKNDKHLELGSGGGFIKDLYPFILTSDLQKLSNVDCHLNAESLPFEDSTFRSISMINVFHHIPRPYLFLREANRCLKSNGYILMIEPACTFLSRFIYKNFHHEPFDLNGAREIESGRPLSNSNQALPYIYFKRDLNLFIKEFPDLEILEYSNHTPFLYLLSGGFSRTSLFPVNTFEFFAVLEKLFSPLNNFIGLFSLIIIKKKSNG